MIYLWKTYLEISTSSYKLSYGSEYRGFYKVARIQ